MKKIIFVVAGLLAGMAAGVRIEANTHALQCARLTGAPYLQVLGRPSLYNVLEIQNQEDARDDEEGMRAGESANG